PPTTQQVASPPAVIDRRFSRHALFFVQSPSSQGWRVSRREARARQGEASRKADAPSRLHLRCARRIHPCKEGLCTKNTSRVLIERPYSCAPQAVGAVYDRPGFFVQSRKEGNPLPRVGKIMDDGKRAVNLFEQQHARQFVRERQRRKRPFQIRALSYCSRQPSIIANDEGKPAAIC